MITHDGDAELELADPSDPFTGGILFSVRPPKKSWKRIQNLSGGEKTLSSLALVFALHRYRPTPIYFLDEIDAALDHRNVSTIGLYVANQAKDAQFIIISLRTHMFELADRLVRTFWRFGSCIYAIRLESTRLKELQSQPPSTQMTLLLITKKEESHPSPRHHNCQKLHNGCTCCISLTRVARATRDVCPA